METLQHNLNLASSCKICHSNISTLARVGLCLGLRTKVLFNCSNKGCVSHFQEIEFNSTPKREKEILYEINMPTVLGMRST